MKGKKSGKSVTLILDWVSKSKKAWKASAGTYNTGIPPSIIAQMIVNEQLTFKGVLATDACIEPNFFLKQLQSRNMTILL